MAETISAVASLLWPLLALGAVLLFRGQIRRLLGNSEVTLEVGGQTVTFTQLNDQQNELIADLQREVAQLREKLTDLEWRLEPRMRPYPYIELPEPPEPTSPTSGYDQGYCPQEPAEPADYQRRYDQDDDHDDQYDQDAAVGTAPDTPPSAAPTTPTTPATPAVPAPSEPARPGVARAVLWVDDNPENNAVILEQLRRAGVHVDLARSTHEAMSLLDRRVHGIVLSDMNRREDGVDVFDAGMRLLAAVRGAEPDLPFVIYSSMAAASAARTAQAMTGGATNVTSSAAIVLGYLRSLGILR